MKRWKELTKGQKIGAVASGTAIALGFGYLLKQLLKPPKPKPPPPPPGTAQFQGIVTDAETQETKETMTLGIYYIWHYPKDYDSNWKNAIRPGLEIALNRLASYFGNKWKYTLVSEFRTSYPIGNGAEIGPPGIPTDTILAAISEWGIDYSLYDMPIFIFANTVAAFCIDWKPPIYMSDTTFTFEQGGIQTLIEHEVGHALGLPDHMDPLTNTEYANCIMGNLYLGKVIFCSECQAALEDVMKVLGTGKPIANASLYIDDIFDTYTDKIGNFRTGILDIGHHVVKITSPFYQTGIFEVDLVEGLQRIDFSLYKNPITGGFEVHWASVNGTDHAIITVGGTATVKAEIGNLLPEPGTQTVCCYLNGESQCLEVTFAGGYQQSGWTAWPKFEFTPTVAGIYTVALGNWSGVLEVKPVVVGEFYCPFCIETSPPIPIRVGLKDGTVLDAMALMTLIYFPAEFTADDVDWIEWDPPDANVTEWHTYYRPYTPGKGTYIIPDVWEKDRLLYYHTTEESFVEHLKTHIKVGASPTGCPYCGLAFECRNYDLRSVAAYLLYEHIKEQHLLQCYSCGKDLTFTSKADYQGDAWISHLAEHGIIAPEVQVTPLYTRGGFYTLEDYNGGKRNLDYRWATASVLFSHFNATSGVVGKGWFIPRQYFWPWPCDPFSEEQTELRIFQDYRLGAMKLTIPALESKSWTCQIVQFGSKDVWDIGYIPVVRYILTGTDKAIIIPEWKLCELRDSPLGNVNFVIKYDNETLVLANMYAFSPSASWGQKVSDFDTLLADPYPLLLNPRFETL